MLKTDKHSLPAPAAIDPVPAIQAKVSSASTSHKAVKDDIKVPLTLKFSKEMIEEKSLGFL